jgi:hypothetical protein
MKTKKKSQMTQNLTLCTVAKIKENSARILKVDKVTGTTIALSIEMKYKQKFENLLFISIL